MFSVLKYNYLARSKTLAELWQNLRGTFGKIPNVILWKSLYKQTLRQLATIEAMSKMDLAKLIESKFNQTNGWAGNDSRFEIGKLHAKHVNLAVQRHVVNRDDERLTNEYVDAFNEFLVNIKAKFSMYNNNEIDDDFLQEYMEACGLLWFQNGEIDVLRKIIDENDAEIRRQQAISVEYQTFNNSLRSMYDAIEDLYYRVREDLHNLNGVKEKIEHIEGEMRYIFQRNNDQQMSILGNTNASFNSAGNSFNVSNDITLSSTHTIFDNARLAFNFNNSNDRLL